MFSHNVRTVRVRYSGRERTVAPTLVYYSECRYPKNPPNITQFAQRTS